MAALTRGSLLWAIAAGLLSVTTLAQPRVSNPAAKAHQDRAVDAFANKNYTLAALEFRAAYLLEAQVDLLFAEAQALRLGGNCPRAISVYQEFLAAGVAAPDAEKARVAIEKCQGILDIVDGERAPAPAPVAPAPAAERSAPTVTTHPVPVPARWYHDATGNVLFGVGLVVASAGGGLFGAGSLTDAQSHLASTYGAFGSFAQQADSDRNIGLAVLGAGAVVLVVALVHYALFDRGADSGEVASPRTPLPRD